MSLNNRIQSLHETDEATAHAIMQEHPAQLDTDKLFKTTYQKFISLKNEQQEKEMTDSEFTEIFECSKEIKATHRFRKVGAYAAFAAACIGFYLFIFRMDGMKPPVDHFPDESNSSDVPQLGGDSNTETTVTPITSETEPIITTTMLIKVPETQQVQTTPAASEVAQTDSIETTLPPPTEVQTTDTTETTTAVTTEPPDLSLQGHFVFNGIDGVTMQISFVRESTEPIRPMQHSFAAEGFTVTDMQEKDSDEVYHSILYRVEREDGQEYQVRMFSSLRVVYVLEPVGDMMTKSYEIDGKPSYLVYHADDPDADCVLMWFDGCHICYVNSPLKNLDDMERLVKSQVAYEGE